MNLFFDEIQNFFRENFWVFLIFLCGMGIIYFTGTGNIFEILVVFSVHFLGDVFIMMMGKSYALGENKKGGIFQLGSFFVFTLLGLYAFLQNGKANYLFSQILFLFSGLKGYLQDALKIKTSFLSPGVYVIFCTFFFGGYYYFDFGDSFITWVQVFGFAGMAFSLILQNNFFRYFGIVISLFLIVLSGSFYIYEGFLLKNITGVDISYTLLPLTVFVYYVKNFKILL